MSFKSRFLKSGVQVLMEPAPNLRSASIGFWIGAGSTSEPKSLTGISHFIEHLLFKGTKNRSAKELSDAFEGLGAEVNAFTGKENTCYYARVIDESLSHVARLFCDMLSAPSFNESDLTFEREVVLEEIHHYEDTPDEIIHDLFAETLWDGHPLGRSILGPRDIVAKLSKGDVRSYFDKNYNFSNLLITVAGSFDEEELFSVLEDELKINSSIVPPKEVTVPKVRSSNRVVKKDTEQAHICLGFEGLAGGHPDRFALNILDAIVAGGMSSRLFQKIREERGLAYAVYSYHSFYRDSGSFVVYVGTRPTNVQEVLHLIDKEIGSILKEGVDDLELERVKNQTKARLVLSLESTTSRMSGLGQSHLLHGEVLSIDELISKVDSVSASDIFRMSERIFKPETRTLCMIGPLSGE